MEDVRGMPSRSVRPNVLCTVLTLMTSACTPSQIEKDALWLCPIGVDGKPSSESEDVRIFDFAEGWVHIHDAHYGARVESVGDVRLLVAPFYLAVPDQAWWRRPQAIAQVHGEASIEVAPVGAGSTDWAVSTVRSNNPDARFGEAVDYTSALIQRDVGIVALRFVGIEEVGDYSDTLVTCGRKGPKIFF